MVHIIGAGPAGTFSAIKLLNKGYDVNITESKPIHKIGAPIRCSGLISMKALQSISLEYNLNFNYCNKFDKLKILTHNNSYNAKLKSNPLVLVDRQEFDLMLLNEAMDKGANLINETFSDSSQLKSNTVIGADGPASTVAHLFDFPAMDYLYTRQGYVKMDSTNYLDKEIIIYIDNDYNGLFGWCFPKDDYLEVGIGTKNRGLLDYSFNKLLSELNLKLDNYHDWIIPYKQRPSIAKNYAGYDVHLIGDSAGQVKPLTGGGIYYMSKAADVLSNTYSPNSYAEQWQINYGNELDRMYYARELAIKHPNLLGLIVNNKKFKLFIESYDTESLTKTLKNLTYSIF